jgi:hypothetical protein
VKFCYCPKCDKLHARNWYSGGRCEICNEKCVIFTVKRSVYGWLMYALDAFALVMLVLYILDYVVLVDWASFFNAIPQVWAEVAIFGSIILSFAMAFIDISKTTKAAEEKVRSGKVQLPPK